MLSSYLYTVSILFLHSHILSAFTKQGIASHSIQISRYLQSNSGLQQSSLEDVTLEIKMNHIDKCSDIHEATTMMLSNVSRRSKSYDLIKVCMMNYKRLYGNMLVPYNYIVLDDSLDWPEAAWGVKLGKILYAY
jgi:hypothetical protein